MLSQTFDDLVTNLRRRRALGHRPPVVLLGAGASLQAGVGTMQQLYDFAKVADFDAFCRYIEPLTTEERYLYLSDFLQTQKPAEVTPGYRALAALSAENYFDLILSTNFDPLLDDALAAARLWRKDYLLLAGGIFRPERIGILLKEPSPRVKVVKLHGDLFHRYMAWTPKEMDEYVSEIRPQLAPALNGRDVLVVGHSLRDERIRELVVGAGGAVWYTHPQEVPDELKGNRLLRAVIGPECKFEELMTGLTQALGVQTSPAAATDSLRRTRGARAATGGRSRTTASGAQTVDDLMA